ncbi:MAG: hypothetical protein K9N40_12860 [Candidatus Cloacimonetes bacterium]|nr:hypothetical protein [Candidatus Cloacimonadota bacterium]
MKEWNKDVYKEIGEKLGVESQLDQTIEEMGELLQAVIKLRRTKDGSKKKHMEAWENLHEEIGDVENMLNQLKWHFDGDKAEKYRQKKLKRAIKRVRKL